MNKRELAITEFTTTPGPRFSKDGPYSGEEFRERFVGKALRDAIKADDMLVVTLDGAAGYAGSFLDEAFAGLIHAGFAPEEVVGHLTVASRDSRFEPHAMMANTYVRQAAESAAASAEQASGATLVASRKVSA